MKARKVVVVATSMDGLRARTLARWLRVLLPAAVLIVSTPDALGTEAAEDDGDAIVVQASTVLSGPLSLADTLVRLNHAVGPGPR
jgi:uncharacterized membrane protein